MGHLDVKHRIVLGLLGHLCEIKIQRRFRLAVKHHEPNGITANLAHHIAKGDEVAGPFSHSDRIAIPQQLDQLAEHDIQLCRVSGNSFGNRLETFRIA